MNLVKNPLLILAIAASVALALSGCGGGGSSGGNRPLTDGGVMNPPITAPGTRDQALDDVTTAANVADAIMRAAAAQPSPGSVTQSSNVDSSNITTDQVEITVRYTQDKKILEVRNGTTWSIDTDEGTARQIPDVDPPWYGAELSKRIEGGVLYVDLYSDIEDPETRQVDSGDDGTMDVPIGARIELAGITAGGGVNVNTIRLSSDGSLAGESGRFECSSGCVIVNGIITGGTWMFTPDRPPGAVDVSGSSGVAVTGSFNPDRWSGTYNGGAGYFRCLSDCGSRTVNGRVMLGSGDWIFVPTSGTTTVTRLDTDYLSGGVWLIVPDDATSASDYVFGAFADGSDPFLQSNVTAVQGTATYDGDATGVYSEEMAGSTEIGYFNGDVTLTADFRSPSDLGTISGSITNFEVDGEATDGRLDLGTANIGSANSGFFKGSVTGSDDERAYTGHWGGQFFGNGEPTGQPGSVAGTFGGHSMDNAVNFVGAFGAHKQ